jgi:hypothetical protein
MTIITLTPTWHGITPMMLAVLENPDAAPSAKATIREQLLRMATIADAYVASQEDAAKRIGMEDEG